MPLIRHKGITLVGISLSNLLDDIPIQLALPFEADRALALDVAIDGVRDRFGTESITRAVLLGQRPGLTMPQLPD
jgi:DNA polymerase-4